MGNEHSKNKELTKNGTILEKHENGASPTSNGLKIGSNSDTIIQQDDTPPSSNPTTESNGPDDYVIVDSGGQHTVTPLILETPNAAIQKEEVKEAKAEKKHRFSKLFKKKTEPPASVVYFSVEETEASKETQTDVSFPPTDPQPEADNLKQEAKSLTEPESVTPDPRPVEEEEEEEAPKTDEGDSEDNQEEIIPEENPVMNFFKTLVTPTKTTKKETATPATKDQSQKESQPAPTTTVALVSEPPAAPKGMSIPPPPPPEPPKMEIKAEPAAKPAKPTAKEEPKAAAKEPESSKGKSARDVLSKFFRPKVRIGFKATKGKGASASGANAPAKAAAVTINETQEQAVDVAVEPIVEVQTENKVEPQEAAEEVAQPVVEKQMVEEVPPQPVVETEKVDPSKASTLEAAAKPEPPPPVQEEKKTASKPSFFSLFKPKAAEPKKATPAPAAAAEAAPTVKAKEEPKGAAKSSEAAVDSKAAAGSSQSGDDSPKEPRKLEKRNSIHLFFKNLGQKRPSTDAGIQTEAAAAAPAAEKAK